MNRINREEEETMEIEEEIEEDNKEDKTTEEITIDKEVTKEEQEEKEVAKGSIPTLKNSPLWVEKRGMQLCFIEKF